MVKITATFHRNVLQSVIFLSLLTGLAAIQCFQCNSKVNPDCKDLTVNDTKSPYYRKCDGNYNGKEPFCRKVETEIFAVENSLRISRSCGWLRDNSTSRVESCDNADTDFIKKRNCECFTDACNSSDRKMASYLLFVAMTIVPSMFLQLII